MSNVVTIRRKLVRDHHWEMLSAAERLDPHWTPERIEATAHACQRLEDDLHIECASDPDFKSLREVKP